MVAPKQATERIGRRLKLRDLRILMTVVECGTMGKAAERLSISQPVVSKAIADMEHALGVPPRPQPARRRADALRSGADQARHRHLRRDATRHRGDRISVRPYGGRSADRSDRCGQCRNGGARHRPALRKYPRMTFHVVAGVPAPLRQELAARRVDFVIARFARPAGEEYSEEILFHDALVVVAGPNNPLTRRRKIVLAELLSEPWVLDPLNTDFGAMQAGIFRAVGLIPPRLTVAAPSIDSARRAASDGTFPHCGSWLLAPPAT